MNSWFRRLGTMSLLWMLASSCNKTNNYPISASSVYYAANYSNFQPFRAFVNTGEIKDSLVLDELYNRESGFFSESFIATLPFTIDSIYFKTASLAFVYNFDFTTTGSNEASVNRTGNNLDLISSGSYPEELDTTIQTKIDTLILLYPLLLADRHYASGQFYWFTVTPEAFAVLTGNDELVVPAMFVEFKTPFSGQFGSINNRFNPNFEYQLLPDGDTLCIREVSEQMKKR